MLKLKEKPVLKDFQDYVYKMEVERNFIHETVMQNCLLLGEEIGELFKAVRKDQGIKMGTHSKSVNIEEELADVLIHLCAIANQYNIELEEELRKKEEINKKRVWK